MKKQPMTIKGPDGRYYPNPDYEPTRDDPSWIGAKDESLGARAAADHAFARAADPVLRKK